MAHLLDRSILTRLANVADSRNVIASQAIVNLHRVGEDRHITAQNLVEFRKVATRPVAVNGLGSSIAEAEAKAAVFEAAFPLLPETPDIFPAWKSLVGARGVIGKQVHDPRLVALCHVHGVTHVLTFIVQQFARLAGFAPGVVVVNPATV